VVDSTTYIFPSLQILIISGYGGKGEKVLQLARIRQALLHGITYNGKMLTFKNSGTFEPTMWTNSNRPRHFVEYCFQYLGFGKPEVEVMEGNRYASSPTTSHSRFVGYLKYGDMKVSWKSGGDLKEIRDCCFGRAAQSFRLHDPSLWDKFLKGVLIVPQTLFKVELRDCGNIEPEIREKLARYT
jgi:hypothetical protein